MTRLFVFIPGLPDYILLCDDTDFVPRKGDRMHIDMDSLGCIRSRRLLRDTPACHCFERNAVTEKQSLGEFLNECVITVSERTWSYGKQHTFCVLDVEVVW